MLFLRLIRLQRHRHRHLCHPPFKIPNALLSSIASPDVQSSTNLNPIVKPSSLTERMSFVFEKIDAIEKERSQKDETLQRIRAWRESKKKPLIATESSPYGFMDSDRNLANKEDKNEGISSSILSSKRELELSHPWPEWVDLMERLVNQNYFDHKRKDEDKMLEASGFSLSDMFEDDGFDFTRDLKTVLKAVINFGNDRFDILRSLSRQDLQILVGYGCPSADKRVVFSSKLLRKYTHLDEGEVCSSCSLRASCEKAYLLLNKEDEARTIDVMRVLLTYAFGAIDGSSVANESLLKKKSLKNSIRKLLKEILKLSSVSIDPNLPPPIKRKPPPKVKQPPPTPRKRVGRDDVEMKKGDWLCTKCQFLNFAKNTICLQCDANRPKRQLLPGEWECPQCNFLNYRRNVVCFHCEHKRPQDDFMENRMQERQQQEHSPRSIQKIPNRLTDVSDAWNFDFDENESDGADIAAFEYGDSHKLNQDYPVEKGFHEEDKYKPGSYNKPGVGFNDFDDEDDIGNYEVDDRNDGQTVPRINLSELEVDDNDDDDDLISENGDRTRKKWNDHRRSDSKDQIKAKRIDFCSDDDIPKHPDWKASNVMQFDRKNKGRSGGGGGMSFGSDDDDEFSSDNEFGSRKKMNQKKNSRLKYGSETDDNDDDDDDDDDIEDDFGSSRRGKGYKSETRKSTRTMDYDSESDNDNHFRPSRGGGRGGGGGQRGRGRNFSGSRGGSESDNDNHFHRGRGGGGQRGRGRNFSGSRGGSESDNDNHFHRGRGGGGGGGGGQRGRGRNMSGSRGGRDNNNSRFSSRKDSYNDGDFKNSRNRGRGGGRSSFNDNNNHGGSYLDDERYRRPRNNVR